MESNQSQGTPVNQGPGSRIDPRRSGSNDSETSRDEELPPGPYGLTPDAPVGEPWVETPEHASPNGDEPNSPAVNHLAPLRLFS